MSDKLPINRGVRQGYPLLSKLFTAVMEEVFKKADVCGQVNVDGENLSNIRFGDSVSLLNEKNQQKTKQIKKQHLNSLKSEYLIVDQ